jgi:hypothetical protein
MPHENSTNEHSSKGANPNRNGIRQGRPGLVRYLHVLVWLEPDRVVMQKIRKGWAGRD